MSNEEFIKSISIDGEEWRDVVGYEGLYIASSFGRIASLRRAYFNGRWCHIKGRIIQPFKTPTGYNYVTLSKEGSHKNKTVHRLVAMSFLPQSPGKPHIDHIDSNKDNNKVSNLRWVTRSENMKNQNTVKKLAIASTGNFNNAKSKPIVSLTSDGSATVYPSIAEACRAGFDKSSIHDCLNGTYKSHRNCKWMYLPDYETLVSMSKSSTDSSAA